MYENQKILIKRRDKVGNIILNDPDALNALSPIMSNEFISGVGILEKKCHVIIVTGMGRAFCAGASLTSEMNPSDKTYDAGAVLEQFLHPMIARIAKSKVPIIAAVNGVAAGGGMALALNCDMVIASEKARFVPAFSSIGLVPDCGISQALVQVVGRLRATEILLRNVSISASEAFRLGLINHIFDQTGFESETHKIASEIANGPTEAYRLTRELLRNAEASELDETLNRECAAQRLAGKTADHAEGLSAFLGRRSPRFTGL